MRLNLDDLPLRSGQRHECSYTIDMAPVFVGGAVYELLLPQGMMLAVDRVAGGFLVEVKMDAKLYGPCSRCLREVEMDLHAEQQEFAPTATGGWADSEASAFIEDLVVDVSGLGREALVLAMPDRLLCSPACKGLCSQCGEDLNRGPCACVALELSEPMR
jgi:uncharacterized protein